MSWWKITDNQDNHSIRLIFFARTFGDQTESALLLLNLLDVLTVNDVCRLQALKFTHSWRKGLLPSLLHDHFFQHASEGHGYYTGYASRQNLYISKVRTNSVKQTIAYTVTILWDNIPTHTKDLNAFNFSKHLKLYFCLNNILKTSNISICSFFQSHVYISFS